MNAPNPNFPNPSGPKHDKVSQAILVACVIITVGIFQGVAPKFWPTPPGGGMNFPRIIGAGIAGGVGAFLGIFVVKLVERFRK
jgi:hypothetical protein